MRQIVIEKSIKRQRVVYKLSLGLVFDYMMLYFLVWIFPIISVKLIWFPSKYNIQPLAFNFIMIVFDMWLLLNLYFMNKLVVVKGTVIRKNRSIIRNIIQSVCPEIVFTSGNNNLLRAEKTVGYQRTKIFTIVLNDDKIYINILHTYRGDGFSFFHGISDYLKSKSIARSFQESSFINGEII